LQTVRKIASAANQSAEKGPTSESLTLDDGNRKVELRGNFDLQAAANLPGVTYRAVYRFSAGFLRERAPIESIQISLSDSSRSYEVEGADVSQVEALASLIEAQFGEHAPIINWRIFRFVAGILILTVAFLFVVAASSLEGVSTKGRVQVACVGFALVAIVVVFPWSNWFSAFRLVNPEASFIVKYANHFGFWSFLVTFLAPIWGLVRRITVTVKPKSAPANSVEHQDDTGSRQ
jgi:hypothetical protein